MRLWRCPSIARLICRKCAPAKYMVHFRSGGGPNGGIEAVNRMSWTGSNDALALAALVALGLVGGARSQTEEMPYTPRSMAST